MHMPTAVAVDAKGRAFVADGANDRVVRFSAAGAFEAALTAVGDQKLSRPVGLTVDARDRLWIADTANHRLLVASADGALVETIALPNTAGEGAHPASPTALAVTASGKRTYVVDNTGHRLLVRDNSGGAGGTWQVLGQQGRGLGQFQWPFAVCLGGEGYVYVSEAIGARVQRVSPTDQWAGQIGQWGVELGEFYRPKGVAADARGRVFVSDSTLGVVQVFNPRGMVLGALTAADGRPYRFAHPMGLAFTPTGALLVVELAADRVAVLRVHDPAPATQPGTAPATQPDHGGQP